MKTSRIGKEGMAGFLRRRGFLRLAAGAYAVGTGGAIGLAMAATPRILNIGSTFNPSSLDPVTGGAGDDHVYLFPIYDTLITWDPDTLEARPGLARDWSFTDSATLLLTLREDVTFQDGSKLDAEAVKVNLDRSRSAEFSNIRADLSSVEEVEVTGEFSVALRLTKPDTALPLILSDRAGMMVSPRALDEHGGRVDRVPVGAGFMKFQRWEDGNQVVLSAYEEYFDRESRYLDGMVYRIIPDTATRLRSTISGQADLAFQLSGRQVPLIDKSPKLSRASGPTLFCYLLYLNLAKPPLNDARIRQALNFAVNRAAFVRGGLAGTGEPAHMLLPESHWAYDTATKQLYSHDVGKARRLLAEAGFPDGINLDFAGYNDQSSVQMQEVLMEQLREAGINGRVVNGVLADITADFFARQQHDVLISYWTGRPDPSLTYSLMFEEKSYFNAGHVAPPDELVQALVESRSVSDVEGRRSALARVQQVAMKEALTVPLAFREDIIAYDSKLEGVRSNLLGKPKFEHVRLNA